MLTPNSSSATVANCASCAAGLVASSATSAARSQARQTSRRGSNGRWHGPIRSALNSSASAAGSCIPSTLPRSSVSARARPARPMSSASRLRSSPPMPAPEAVSSYTLGAVIAATEKLTGCQIARAYVDKGYRGHDTTNPRRVFISGQKRGVFGVIKRELRRRSAIEAVIGHLKTDGHLGRCYLKGRAGDAANAVLTAVGYNLRLVLAWLRILLRLILGALLQALALRPPLLLNRRLITPSIF